MSGASGIPAQGIPQPGDPVSSEQYWNWLRRHQLRVQSCTECGTTRNPPSELCHVCHATASEWVRLVPEGRVFSWTRVWHPVGEVMRDHVPYLIVWVEIEHPDRPRFLGNLVGDGRQPVEIGDAVVGVFEDRPGGTILNWEPVTT